jgi:octaprenyl-diphosphate synthase
LTLKEIISPVNGDIAIFEDKYKEIMRSNVTVVDLVAKYLVKHKGKFLRPILVLLASRVCGKPSKNTYIASAVVELLHVATLVHDDVVDDADTRHGFPSIKAKWKNKIAVLMGDYLLSKSLIGATLTNDLAVIHLLADAAKRLSKGELMQLEKSRKKELEEEEYFELISDKTAALISTCSELGAMTSDNNTEKSRLAMKHFGENLGKMFQIKDDLLDYESKSSILGKPSGNDIQEGKLTLPLIYALKVAEKKESNSIVKELKKSDKKKDIRRIVDFVHNYGGIDYAYKKAHGFGELAKRELLIFPDSIYKEACYHLVDYVINRKK